MKKLFLAIALLASVASCTKDDVINESKEAIGFAGPFVENSTRAAVDPSLGTTVNPFTSFNVYGTVGGVSIYNGETVTGTVGSAIVDGKETNVWTCASTKQYWVSGAQYKFAALANAGTVILGSDNLPATTTFDATNANVDLLYAEPVSRTGKASGNEPVAFTFNHLLSKVKFTVINGSSDATGYSFEVSNITVTCPKSGTITLANKTWSNLSAAAAYSVPAITVNNSTASEECANELLLIPGSVSINFAVNIKYDDTTIATHTPAAAYTATIVGGNSYNFVINVAVGQEIKFNVESNPTWTPNADITIQ